MAFTQYAGENQQVGFEVGDLFQVVEEAVLDAKQKLLRIKNNKSSVSIGEMFEMQMLMNHLSQLSEMSTSVVSACNTAISRMSQNIK